MFDIESKHFHMGVPVARASLVEPVVQMNSIPGSNTGLHIIGSIDAQRHPHAPTAQLQDVQEAFSAASSVDSISGTHSRRKSTNVRIFASRYWRDAYSV